MCGGAVPIRRRRGRWSAPARRAGGGGVWPVQVVLVSITMLLVASFGGAALPASAPLGNPTTGGSGAVAPAAPAGGPEVAPAVPGAWVEWGDHDHARVEAVATPLVGAGPSLY